MLNLSHRNSEKFDNNFRLKRAREYFIFSLMLVLILMSIAIHFHAEPYGYDETWMVGANQGLNPLTALPPLIRIWVLAFGTAPAVTRWLSALILVLGFVLVSRLGAALFDRRVLWLAPFLLGSLNFLTDFGGRATLYALPFMTSAALCWLFWLWMRQPRQQYAAAYILSVVLMGITYPLGLWLVALQFIFAVVTFRPRRIQLLTLPCIAIVLGLTGMILVGLQGENIVLAIERSLAHFNPAMRLMMADNLQLLLLIGLAACGLVIGWQGDVRRASYLVMMISGLWVINSFTSTGGIPFNLIALTMPLIAILAARGMSLVVRPVRLMMIIGYVLLTFTLMKPNQIEVPPYPKMAAQITPGSGVIISAPIVAQQAASLFYIHQRMPDVNPFHIVELSQRADMRFLPVSSSNTASGVDGLSIQQLTNWAQDYNEIWYIEDDPSAVNADLAIQSLRGFTPYTVTNWAGERATEKDLRRIVRYMRVPLDLQNLLDFGDHLLLQKWTLQNDINVHACQTISVQSWWRLQQPAQTNYSLSLTLVNTSNGQGVAHTDSALGANETLLWKTSQSYFDERFLTIPCDLVSGDYPLLFSVYSLENNAIQYLIAKAPNGSSIGDHFYLTTLHVQGAS